MDKTDEQLLYESIKITEADKRVYSDTMTNMLLTAGDTTEAHDAVWYAHLISQCTVIFDKTFEAPAGVGFHFKWNLYINPNLFNTYTLRERIAILIHESLHILNIHAVRRKNIDHELFNIAADTAINQMIKGLPVGCMSPEKFDPPLPLDLNSEQYYELIKEQTKTCPVCGSKYLEFNLPQGDGKGDGERCGSQCKTCGSKKMKKYLSGGGHDKWGTDQEESLIKEATKGMIQNTRQKTRGYTPATIQHVIELLWAKAVLDWRKYLRIIVGNRKANKRPTIKKCDRRFPTRYDLRGKTSDTTFDLLVVVDVSGSMMDDEIYKGLVEIHDICKKTETEVNMIQVDTQPKDFEKFDKKTKLFTRKAAGGTYLFPAIEKARAEKIHYDAIVMITDGMIERDWVCVPKVPIFWLITSDHILNFNHEKYKNMKVFDISGGFDD